MAENEVHNVDAWLSILGLAVTVLGGMFLFLWNGITGLRRDFRADMDRTNGEHRDGLQKVWSQINVNEGKANDYRSRIENQIGSLATRADVQAARTEVREDLKDMEGRIMRVMANGQNH